jgi:hypothetical protein
MSPISARSRRPACVVTSMLSSSARASDGSSTGVCPHVTTCRGPRTDAAGLTGTTWPVTSPSNRWRIAASSFLVSRSAVRLVAGEFFVGRHHLYESEHSIQEMLPHVTDHQISPGF